jgi:hypothetical protein
MQADVLATQEELSSFIQDQQAIKLGAIRDDCSTHWGRTNAYGADTRHKAILKWLSPTFPNGSQLAAHPANQEGNTDWILNSEEFVTWRNNTAQTPILWLSGIPGAGKTTLFAKVVQHFRLKLNDPAQNDRLAFFFCDFRTPGSQVALNVIGSLVAQLCTQRGWFPPELESSYNESINSAGKEIAPGLPILTGALISLAQQSNITLLIDALDECQNSNEITDVLNNIKQEAAIKIFVTGRDETRINSSLGNCIRIRLEARDGEVSEAIRSYIQARLDTEVRLQWLSPSFKENILKTLLSKSGGMFRWVQCQLDQISPLRTVRAIRKALDDLPDGLDDTYERILLGVPRHHIDVVHKIFQWLSISTSPLTLLELHDAIAIDPELDFLDEESQLSSPQDIFDLCSSLTTVTDTGTIQLAHASVKEYLLSDKIKNSPTADFALNPKESMIGIARCCLAYLSFKELESGPAISYEEYKLRMARFPLLNHAAIAWPYQILAAGEPPELKNEIIHFLTANHNTFMSWIQILNALPLTGMDAETAWSSYPKLATPLYYAASFGLYQIVYSLVDAGADLNAPASRFGGTALHGAVVRHHIPVIKLLLEAGADVNKCDFNSTTPLHSAMWHDENEIVSLLLKYGARRENMPKEWVEPLEPDRFARTRGVGMTKKVETTGPGNDSIQRYLDRPEGIKSFDIFTQI